MEPQEAKYSKSSITDKPQNTALLDTSFRSSESSASSRKHTSKQKRFEVDKIPIENLKFNNEQSDKLFVPCVSTVLPTRRPATASVSSNLYTSYSVSGRQSAYAKTVPKPLSVRPPSAEPVVKCKSQLVLIPKRVEPQLQVFCQPKFRFWFNIIFYDFFLIFTLLINNYIIMKKNYIVSSHFI
jgi:hypothetical protein